MARHDEPNEYGFAGDPTGPQPVPAGSRDEVEAAEREAVPGSDLTEGLREAVEDVMDGADRDRPQSRR